MEDEAMRRILLATMVFCFVTVTGWSQEEPFDQEVDHVYMTQNGVDFYMDIFRPNGKGRDAFLKPTDKGKGLAILDIASGGWSTDRGKIEDHVNAKMFHIFCARGYTVFAVRPGSKPDYDVAQMVSHLKHAIRYIKSHADEYGIDPDRIGLTGASAGGHLGLMTVFQEEMANEKATDPLLKFSTEVKAAAIFFPPTNFLEWEGKENSAVGEMLGDILFVGGTAGKTQEEINAKAREFSPITYVKAGAPPIYIMHGDADPIVPLSQSTQMVEALKAAGNEVEFYVKPGGTHPWLTIPLEIITIADWFDGVLNRKAVVAEK
jgi:acetyl esterase/lipase